MPHRLMFVCAMNVCRSPLMAYTFTESLAAVGDESDWSVSSRGIAVTRRNTMCDVSASLISDTETGQAFIAAHVSSPVATARLAQQDLILVATRAERAELANINPALRQRTFTVREAIALGNAPATSAELELVDRTRHTNQKIRLGGYHQLLNLRRGTVPMPVPRHTSWILRNVRRHDPIDLPDVHHERTAKHGAVLREAQADVRALHGQLRDFLWARSRAA